MKQNFLLALLVFYPFLGGLLAWLVGRKAECGFLRDVLADFVVITEFAVMLAVLICFGSGDGAAVMNCCIPGVCGFGLFFVMDGFRLIYGTVACLMWMMTAILSREYFRHHENQTRFYVFFLLTFGATMGVFLSADLYTTFIFFEIMSFTSFVWVAQEENAPSLRAAKTYLAVAVIGGLVMLMGIFLTWHELGTLTMSELLPAARKYLAHASAGQEKTLYAAGICMLVGFGAKAGAFPLHIWLPKAHPVAPAPASALLSGILTKTGIFGILVISSQIFLYDAVWGKLILAVGVLTMFGGALLAVFSIDLKRTLACSSMSQIGFILTGVGMQGLLGEENAMAVHGTMLHMVNHSLIKLVLFMAAGVIFMNTHSLDLNEIRGYGRKKPLLKTIFLTGALAIGGIPLFGGYISKTLLHESIVEFGGGLLMKAVEWIFLFSGGLTVAYMTKLFVSIFVEKNNDKERQQRFDREKKYMNPESTFALAGSAAVLLIWGLCPYGLMDRAAALGQRFMNLEEFGHRVSYFSLKNLSGGLISIAIGAAVYVFVIRRFLMQRERGKAAKYETMKYVNVWPSWLDLENLIYRPVLMELLPLVLGSICKVLDGAVEMALRCVLPVCGVLCRLLDSLVDLSIVGLRKSVYRDSPLPHELPEGTRLTLWMGQFFNAVKRLLNSTVRRKHPVEKDYVHALAVKREEIRESNVVTGRSLSFALLLFCIGFCVTIFYLLWW